MPPKKNKGAQPQPIVSGDFPVPDDFEGKKLATQIHKLKKIELECFGLYALVSARLRNLLNEIEELEP